MTGASGLLGREFIDFTKAAPISSFTDDICDAEAVDEPLLSTIQQRIDSTNPAQLHRDIDAALDVLWRMPCKTTDVPENVFETLTD